MVNACSRLAPSVSGEYSVCSACSAPPAGTISPRLHPVSECRRRSVHQLDLISERKDSRLVQGVTGCAVAVLQAAKVNRGHDGDARVGELPGRGETALTARVGG